MTNEKPIGAWVTVKYKSVNQEISSYVSFGEYDAEAGCSQPDGVHDDRVFIYASQEELIDLTKNDCYAEWVILSIDEYVYDPNTLMYEDDDDDGDCCCEACGNAQWLENSMADYFAREVLQNAHDANIRRQILKEVLAHIGSLIPKDESVGCDTCKQMAASIVEFIGDKIKKSY